MALDWAKCFDSIHLDSLGDSMRRIGFPHSLTQMLLGMMRARKFYVEDFGSCSEQRRQHSGITQGCTLSPLLFIVMMSVLMHDAIGMLSPAARAAYERGDLADITFADDTLLMGVSPQFLSEFLDAMASAGRRYGMELHYGKLQLLNVQCNCNFEMPNGQQLVASDGMTYLGTVLTEDGRLNNELGRRIGAARAELVALTKVWRHSSLTTKRKLQIYSSLVESKLLYGLLTCSLTVAELRRLDGFQAKCLRQVLRIQPSFYSRISNKTVLVKAGSKSASELLAQQQLVMLGRVLRSPQTSALHKSALVPGTLLPATSFYIRRQGRPRKEWAPTVLQAAYAKVTSGQDLRLLAQDADAWKLRMRS